MIGHLGLSVHRKVVEIGRALTFLKPCQARSSNNSFHWRGVGTLPGRLFLFTWYVRV